MDANTVSAIATVLMTIVTAATVGVMIQQNAIFKKQNEIIDLQLKVELYDKRIKVYAGVMEMMGIIISYVKVTDEQYYRFLGNISGGEFLLDTELWNYLQKEFTPKVIEVLCDAAIAHNSMTANTKEAYEAKTRLHGNMKWCIAEQLKVKEKFKKYLAIEMPTPPKK